MFIHSIVYLILTVLMAMAAFAASMPIGKAPREHNAPAAEKETVDILQS